MQDCLLTANLSKIGHTSILLSYKTRPTGTIKPSLHTVCNVKVCVPSISYMPIMIKWRSHTPKSGTISCILLVSFVRL